MKITQIRETESAEAISVFNFESFVEKIKVETKARPVSGFREAPVSYTHLDVYKRQPLYLGISIMIFSVLYIFLFWYWGLNAYERQLLLPLRNIYKK